MRFQQFLEGRQRVNDIGIILLSVVFGAMAAISAHQDTWWLFLAPLLVVMGYLLLVSPRVVWMSLAFLTPLSILFEETVLGGVGFYLPTEPLLLVFTILLLLQALYNSPFCKEMWKQSFIWVVIAYLVWVGICCVTSVRPVVSLKFWLSKVWYIVPVFMFGISMFRSKDIALRFLKLYVFSLFVVAIYTLVHHAIYGFAEKPAHWVMQPFFKDHTQLGAVYGLILPVVIFLFNNSRRWSSRIGYGVILLVFITGLYYTYSRAALLGVVVAALLFVFVWVGVSFRYILMFLAVFMLSVMLTFQSLYQWLERNQTDSSDNFLDNLESVTNITTDASNVERLNRWQCAIDMFVEKPIFGWGPGVYMFEYAPFQRSNLQTIISTNVGNVGNAHSEYLGPLAETGLIGMIAIMAVFFLLIYQGIRIFERYPRSSSTILVLACSLGIVSYAIHGILNNFLDTDKVSVLFWGMAALVIAMKIDMDKTCSEITNTKENKNKDRGIYTTIHDANKDR